MPHTRIIGTLACLYGCEIYSATNHDWIYERVPTLRKRIENDAVIFSSHPLLPVSFQAPVYSLAIMDASISVDVRPTPSGPAALQRMEEPAPLIRQATNPFIARDEGLQKSAEHALSCTAPIQYQPEISFRCLCAATPCNVGELVNAGQNPDTRDNDGNTPLHIAAASGSVNIARTLIQADADVEAIAGEQKFTPLLVAASSGHTAMAIALVNHGSNIDAVDVVGCSALHIAAINGNVALTLALIKMGARIDLKSFDGWTPLHTAAGFNRPAAISVLVRYGANTNSRDRDGDTPLITAVSLRRIDCVQQLLASGANPRLLTEVRRQNAATDISLTRIRGASPFCTLPAT